MLASEEQRREVCYKSVSERLSGEVRLICSE